MLLEPDMETEAGTPPDSDDEAARICELVVEAGVLLDWLSSGRVAAVTAWGALDLLRADLCLLADHTADPCACQAALGTIAAIDAALQPLPDSARGAA